MQLREQPVDWLLGATIGMCWTMLALLGIGLGALALAIPSMFLFSQRIFAQIAVDSPGITMAERPWIVGVLIGAAAIVGFSFLFVRTLLAIVDSVHTGDPFTGENAVRLEKMGWLGVGVQLGGILTSMIAWRLSAVSPKVDLGFGLDLSSVVLILLLFVLARVFRAGAAMRADLEGTV